MAGYAEDSSGHAEQTLGKEHTALLGVIPLTLTLTLTLGKEHTALLGEPNPNP